MPGGRLTEQDRRQIAEGLAEGLNYSEIAQRLGRPTSTVSREVARNGGPSDYQPAQAHQATEVRARRTKPAPRPTAPAATGLDGRDPRAVHALEERISAILIQTGLPRIASGVLACLYASDAGSLTAAELVQRLQVSPATISKAVGYLEEQELIRREHNRRERRDRYVIDGDAWYRAWLASIRMNAALAEAAEDGAKILGATTPAGTRLERMGEILRHGNELMIEVAEQWRRRSDER